MNVSTIELDLAKDVFQVHGIADDGKVIFNREIRRKDLLNFFDRLSQCLVGMEACGSAHHWGREIRNLGHDVRLMPASYVKPYVKRGKSDAADAEAICEAVRRPTMRFVEIKMTDQQAILAIHRWRDLVVRQRTQVVNMIRNILREFGHVLPNGIDAVIQFAVKFTFEDRTDIPPVARGVVLSLCDEFLALHQREADYMNLIDQHVFINKSCKKLMTIPGIGPITASAIVATIGDGKQFRSGRDLPAWLGLTPLNKSSGGKERLGKITKKGDRYLRKLIVIGMTSRALQAKTHPERADFFTVKMLRNKPFRLATIAMANKTARIVWAVLTKGKEYRQAAI